jgi:hypothetical protein
MNQEEITEVLRLHSLWVKDNTKGKRANLAGANLAGATLPHYAVCPETGAFEAYKRVGHNTILRLLIPAHAVRVSSLVGRKCRASEVKVMEVVSGDPDDLTSTNDFSFHYEVGGTFKPANGFSDDIRIECAPGIHFFMTRREAEEF